MTAPGSVLFNSDPVAFRRAKRKEAEAMVDSLDVNGDGMLEREEVMSALERLPSASTQELDISQLFDALDVDKSGTLDYAEFVAMMSGARPEQSNLLQA